jgi:PEP-CTERM motif-containing protein
VRNLDRGWRQHARAVLLVAASSLAFAPAAARALLFGQSEVDGTATAVVPPTNWSDQHFATDGTPLSVSQDVQQTLQGRTSTVDSVRATSSWTPGQLHASASVEFPGVVYCIPPDPFCNGAGTVQGSAHAFTSLEADDVDFSQYGGGSTNITLDFSGVLSSVFAAIDGTTMQSYQQQGSAYDRTVSIGFSLSQREPSNCEGNPCTILVNLAGGNLTVTQHYDGTTTVSSFGFANAPSSWTNGTHQLISQDFTPDPSAPGILDLQIDTKVPTQYSHSGGDHILAGIDFSHTFGLTTAGPVFALGAGGSVDVPSLHVFDNVFTPVPEPATVFTLGMGLAALAFRGAARRR